MWRRRGPVTCTDGLAHNLYLSLTTGADVAQAHNLYWSQAGLAVQKGKEMHVELKELKARERQQVTSPSLSRSKARNLLSLSRIDGLVTCLSSNEQVPGMNGTPSPANDSAAISHAPISASIAASPAR